MKTIIHWLIVYALCFGVGGAIGLVLAVIRCGLDYIGWWPMHYPKGPDW